MCNKKLTIVTMKISVSLGSLRSLESLLIAMENISLTIEKTHFIDPPIIMIVGMNSFMLHGFVLP